jgi:hypothetical protein
MTLPLAFHVLSVVVEGKLAEAVEGAVCSLVRIFRMFDSNLQRLFLKFKRFSSLKNSCRVSARIENPAQPRAAARAAKPRRLHGSCVRIVRRLPCRRLHLATDRSPFASIPLAIVPVFARTARRAAPPPSPLAFA